MSISLAQIACELGIRVFWWTLQTREDVSDQSRVRLYPGLRRYAEEYTALVLKTTVWPLCMKAYVDVKT